MNADSLFRPAQDVETRLRAMVYGGPGSGKTTSCIQIGLGLVGGDASRVCLLDSEHGSAAKAGRDLSADFFHADVNAFRKMTNRGDLVEFDPRVYEVAIREAAERFDVVVVDSLSHAWEAARELKDRIGDSWNAWKTITPMWRSLIETILTVDAHVLVTARAKVKRELIGRKLKVIGEVPIVRDGTEYEFDIVLRMDDEHAGTVEKARSVEFDGARIERPGPDFGKALGAWLSKGGEDPEAWATRMLAGFGLTIAGVDVWRKSVDKAPLLSLSLSKQRQFVAWLSSNGESIAAVKSLESKAAVVTEVRQALGVDKLVAEHGAGRVALMAALTLARVSFDDFNAYAEAEGKGFVAEWTDDECFTTSSHVDGMAADVLMWIAVRDALPSDSIPALDGIAATLEAVGLTLSDLDAFRLSIGQGGSITMASAAQLIPFAKWLDGNISTVVEYAEGVLKNARSDFDGMLVEMGIDHEGFDAYAKSHMGVANGVASIEDGRLGGFAVTIKRDAAKIREWITANKAT